MTRVVIVLILYILIPFIIVELYKRYAVFRRLGVVVLAYLAGVIMAISGLNDFQMTSGQAVFERWQSILMNISISLSIPLLLFHCDFKLWTRSLPKTFFVLGSGIISVFISILGGFFLFKHFGVAEFNKVCAMMMGIYSGGTMNFNALGASLGIDKSIMTIVLAFEMVLTAIYLMFILGGGFRLYRKILPETDKESGTTNKETQIKLIDIEDYHGLLHRNNFESWLLGLGISLLIVLVGVGISMLITGRLNEMIVILTITTLSILCSFFKKIRNLRKTFEIGMYLILLFSVIVASLFDWHCLRSGIWGIGLLIIWTIVISSLLHILLCKFYKVEGDLFTVSQVALLCSPPFVPPIVSVMKNKKIMLSGIVIGLVGYALGTYLGIIMNYLINWLSQL